jgi:hypothetical protein
MWMGGNVPLGYDASEGTLVLNPVEAETVRRICALHGELGSVRRVKEEPDRLGLRTKLRVTANGTEHGGKPFARGHFYRLLSNPIYAAQIAHKGQLFLCRILVCGLPCRPNSVDHKSRQHRGMFSVAVTASVVVIAT